MGSAAALAAGPGDAAGRLEDAFAEAARSVEEDGGLSAKDRVRQLRELERRRASFERERRSAGPAELEALFEAVVGTTAAPGVFSSATVEGLQLAWSRAEGRRRARSRDYLAEKDRRASASIVDPAFHLKALREGVVPDGTVYSPEELGWDLPAASRLGASPQTDGTVRFSVVSPGKPPRLLRLSWEKDPEDPAKTAPMLRTYGVDGKLRAWTVPGRQGEEGLFDENGSLVTGRSWRGDEQTVVLRGKDAEGRPQVSFHKYLSGKKASLRTVTLDPAGRTFAVEERDASGAVIFQGGPEEAKQKPAAAPAPKPRPGPAARPKPKPRPAPRIAPHAVRAQPAPAPAAPSPAADPSALVRALFAEFYPSVFEVESSTVPARGPASMGRRERIAAAVVHLGFGVSEIDAEHLRQGSRAKLAVAGPGLPSDKPLRVDADYVPLIPVEIKMGKVLFVSRRHPVPKEEYLREAERASAMLRDEPRRGRLRAAAAASGWDAGRAKAWLDAASANLARFEKNLPPFLDAAAELPEGTGLSDGR